MSKNGYNLDMMYKRALAPLLLDSKYSILLLGPRQTGKSTLLRGLKPDLEINFADEQVFLSFSANPQRLQEMLAGSRPKTIFIDEIQRLPSLLNTVQALLDTHKGRYRFFLSGSSARKLRRGQANLLPGRVLAFYLSPIHLLETSTPFSMNILLSYGSLPGILTETEIRAKKQLLTSYAGTYLKEEIQAEALTKNIEGFSRFLFVIAAKNGEFVDYAKLGAQAGINQKTATRFFEILEDTLIVHRLNAFAGSDLRRMVQHPKFYFFDTGVLNGLLNNFTPSQDRIGMLYETLVFSQISAALSSNGIGARFSTYRTNKNVEVDFIVETEKKVWAIEVKASKNIGVSELRGLKSFLQVHPKATPLVIYLGEERLEKEGVAILPLAEAMALILKKG
jgi:predicted AAA+ superfamily ATPase